MRSSSALIHLPRGVTAILYRSALAITIPLSNSGAQVSESAGSSSRVPAQERARLASPSTAVSAMTPLPTTTVLAPRAEVRLVASRTTASGTLTIVPFDGAEKVLTCSVLRACVVELEPGEVLVNEPVAGDLARWIIMEARAGPVGANTLVIVKPKACDITTNLVLSTNRRIYDLDLDSPPCRDYVGSPTNPKREYVRHVRFSYPEDSVRTARSAVRTVFVDSAGSDSVVKATPRLNHDYAVVRARRGWFGVFGEQPLDFPWVPTAVADDGAHVYITLPPEARQHTAPVLYAVENDGSRTLVNYTMRDTTIVTDRTFRRGLFVIAVGEREQRLEFENRGWSNTPDQSGREP